MPVFELSLIGVANPNVGDRENIVLRPAQTVDLSDFGLLVGLRTTSNAIIPLRDHFFWFGNVTVSPPSWLIVHTGMGAYEKKNLNGTGDEVHHFYWNREWTIFSSPNHIPVVFRLGSATFGTLLAAPAPPKPLSGMKP